jgi:hypothetical protein
MECKKDLIYNLVTAKCKLLRQHVFQMTERETKIFSKLPSIEIKILQKNKIVQFHKKFDR